MLFSGALEHLRNHYPNAKITICIQRYVANYIELCPFIDEIVYWEDLIPKVFINLKKDLSSKSLKNLFVRFYLKYSPINIPSIFYSLLGYNKLANNLKKYNSDILLMPVRSPTNWIHSVANFIPAKVKYGVLGDLHNISLKDNQLSKFIYNSYLDLSEEKELKHEILTTQSFLALLGIKIDKSELWPGVWTNKSDVDEANIKAKNTGLLNLVICPSANSFLGKIYPLDKYKEIISSIKEKQLSIFILGALSELALCKELEYNLNDCKNVVSIYNLVGLTTIRQMVEILRKSDLVLTLDNGAMHLSITLGKPTVSIVGGGAFIRYYPWGDPLIHRFAYLPMDCYGCKWRCCYSTVRCITELPPKIIANEIIDLLK